FFATFLDYLYRKLPPDMKVRMGMEFNYIYPLFSTQYLRLVEIASIELRDERLVAVLKCLVEIFRHTDERIFQNNNIHSLYRTAVQHFCHLAENASENIIDPSQMPQSQHRRYMELYSELLTLFITRFGGYIFRASETMTLLNMYSQILFKFGPSFMDISTPEDEHRLPKDFIMDALVAFSTLIKRFRDSNKSGHPAFGLDPPIVATLNSDFVTNLVNILVNYYLGVHRVDVLYHWETEPIDWFHEYWNNNDSTSIAHHSLELFSLILECFPDEVLPLLNQYRELVKTLPSSESSVLHVDGLNVALGTDYNRVILPTMTANQFFQSYIFPFLQESGPFPNVVEHRAAWFLTKLEFADVDDEVRYRIFDLLDNLLTPTKSLVVRLAATEALERWLFEQIPLEPRILIWRESVMEKLWSLFQETCAHSESLILVTGAIEQMAQCVGISEESLTWYLHRLSERKEAIEMSDQVFLHTVPIFRSFISSPDLNIDLFAESLCNLVVHCVKSDRGELVQVGIDLWQTLIFYKNDVGLYAGPLVSLLFEKYATENEFESTFTDILVHYLIMDLNMIISCRKADFFGALSTRIKKGNHVTVKSVCRVMEAMICSDVNRTEPLAAMMAESACFGYLVNTFIHARNDYQAKDIILLVLARLVLHQTDEFVEALKGLSSEDDPSDTVVRLIECWLFAYPEIAHPKHRKLSLLALGKLIFAAIEECDYYVPSVLEICINFLYNYSEDASGDSPQYSTSSDSITDRDMLEHCKPLGSFQVQIDLLRAHDPVHIIHTGKAVVGILEQILEVFPGGVNALEESLTSSPYGYTLQTLYNLVQEAR
ncbi:hypothetical protein IWQ61_010106, partial [Dispira simplex]